jgi:type I restriction enzyme S subunit
MDLDEQRSIADYLDTETARIDALIEKKRRMVSVLREQRQSVIDDVVMGLIPIDGVSPTVGRSEMRLRFLLRERDVRGQASEEVLSVYRDLGVLPKAGRVDNFNKTPADLSLYKLALPGDVVVNKMKAWQGSIAVSRYRGIVSGDYLVCSVVGDVDRSFLHHLLRSRPMVGEYARRSNGIRPSQWRLYWEGLAEIRASLPPRDSQHVMAAYLDAETNRIDAVVACMQTQVSLLQEHRQALITAAVTGELTIPELAA